MIRWIVEHPTTVAVAVLVTFLFGSLSYMTLPRESAPDITIPVVLVNTMYQGVAPKDIEALVTTPLERELAGLKDVKKMASTSAEGMSSISIEFQPDVVIEDALQKVRDRVNRAKGDLPEDAKDPSIREINFSDMPIVMFNIAGDVDEQVLKKLAEDVQDEVERVPGVLDAKVSGGMTREVQVLIDPVRLAHYGLALHDVTGAIRDENINIPGGEVRSGEGTILIRTPGEFTSAEQVENVSIKRVGDRPVFVRDVGRVVSTYKERSTYARMNGTPSVSLSVSKRSGANIIEVSDAAKAIVAKRAKAWPQGVRYRVLADQSIRIRDMVSDLQNNIITALLLVVGVIFVFMGARSSFFVALSIPLSMLMSFAIIDLLGYTLNMIVLFSLILALGMLVDNAIVIVENIYRHYEEGKSPLQAAIDGTDEVAIPVAASTLTTVGAFFPLVFWTGIMGEFMGFLPKTVIVVLICSFIAAVGVLPVLAGRMLGRRHHDANAVSEPVTYGWLMTAYRAVLHFSIRFRYPSAALGAASFVFTVVIYGLFQHGVEFFPATQPDRATIGVRLPDGTDLESTDRVVRQLEAMLAAEPNVDVFVAETGVSGNGRELTGFTSATNEARVTVDFLKDRNAAEPGEKVRVEPTTDTVLRLRHLVAQIPGAEISVNKEEMGPPVGKAISVELSGDDYDAVGEAAQELRRALVAVPGVATLEDDYRVGRPELRLRVDRGAAARVGVSSASVGNAARTAVAGTKASALRDGEDEYDIMVRLAPEFREDLQQVLDLRLPGRELTSPDTFPVPLSAVASYELAGGTGAIHHTDQELVITVSGDVLDGANANEVQAQIEARIGEWEFPAGVHAVLKGSNKEQDESAAFLGRAFLLALCIILLVLVTQFDSLALPAIIMATVGLSLIGVLWGLLITGTPFGIIMTGLGVISLAGVVVNNAIVLLDYVQQLEKEGYDVHDALIQAGTVRFRPVMLTAVTTVLGLVPMGAGLSFDFTRFRWLIGGASADWWGPMAWAMIFGLSFATVLTLVMVPTFYSIYDDMRVVGGRVWSRFRGVALPVASASAVALLLVLPGDARALTLDEAYAAAARNNVDLAMAHEQAVQAGTLRTQAWASLSPTVTASGSYNVNQYEVAFSMADLLPPGVSAGDPIVIQRKHYWQGSVTAVQPLFSGPALPLLKGAYATSNAGKLDERRAQQSIRAAVAQTYLGAVQARDALALAEDAVKLAESQVELASRQVAAGVSDDRAALSAALNLSRARRDRSRAEEAVLSADLALERIIGEAPRGDLEHPAAFDVSASLEQALEQAKRDRPDLGAMELRITAAKAQSLGTKLQWAPRVDARLTYSYSENTGFNPDQKLQWMGSLNATWQLWDGGFRLAQTASAASQSRSAQLGLERLQQQSLEQVRNAWERHERATASLKAVEAEQALAARNLELAQRAYQAGSATWLEVEQAQLSVNSAALALLTERSSRSRAAIELLLATGSL